MDKTFKFSQHAADEMTRRNISRDLALSVLQRPEQVVEEQKELKAYKSKVKFEDGRTFLLRLIVNEDTAIVVTVYRTSKIEKYWRKKS